MSISGAASTADDDQSMAMAHASPIAGDIYDQPSIDFASVAALSAFMPSVTSAQLIASSIGASADPAAVDEQNFASVSMLFLL